MDEDPEFFMPDEDITPAEEPSATEPDEPEPPEPPPDTAGRKQFGWRQFTGATFIGLVTGIPIGVLLPSDQNLDTLKPVPTQQDTLAIDDANLAETFGQIQAPESSHISNIITHPVTDSITIEAVITAGSELAGSIYRFQATQPDPRPASENTPGLPLGSKEIPLLQGRTHTITIRLTLTDTNRYSPYEVELSAIAPDGTIKQVDVAKISLSSSCEYNPGAEVNIYCWHHP